MNANGALLPKGFEDLEPFAPAWALPTERERMFRRYGSDMASIKAFYDAMIERIDAVLDHLDQFDLDAMPPAEQRLLSMSQSLVEVANAVEVYGLPTSPFACEPERFESRTVDRNLES
jgi:hypothetical protein